MVEPPLLIGAVKVTEAVVFPAVAVAPVGELGTDHGRVVVERIDPVDVP